MPAAPRAAVVLLAAGDGRRVGAATNKVLLPLAGLPVFGWSLRVVEQLEYVVRVLVVARERDQATITATLREHFPDLTVDVVTGGDTRHASERNALRVLEPAIDSGAVDVVVVHDTARPLAEARLFRSVIASAGEHGGALPVRRLPGLVRRDSSSPRVEAQTELVGVQTPQAFGAATLLRAYRDADRDGFTGTDTASCVERYAAVSIHCVPSPASNLKITFPEDLTLAARLL